MFVAVETVAVDCPLSSPCLFASYSAARHSYMFHHQSLTDYQRSEMIRSPAAAATTQSSWWFVTSQCQVPVYNKTTLSWVCDDDAVSVCVCVCVCEGGCRCGCLCRPIPQSGQRPKCSTPVHRLFHYIFDVEKSYFKVNDAKMPCRNRFVSK